MSENFYKNSFGSLKLTLEDNIMTAEFKGSVSASIAQYFLKTAEKMINDNKIDHWGYISYSEQADAATPEAHLLLIKAAKIFYQAGCVKSAYVLKSSIAIRQIEKLREEMGVTAPLSNVLFKDLQQAKQFMFDFLKDYQA
ncbi:MAG: hypothetical protein ACJAZB_001646 [Psychrosphaera sp.]|jgi:hypothetical protein